MIDKKLFIEYIEQYQRFDKAFERIEEALMGKKYSSNLFESDWVESVGGMLDIFLKSHFTEEGCDLINWWLFEDVDKVIYEKNSQLDFFDEFKEDNKIPVETIEQLWNYMNKNKDVYLL